MYFLYILEGIIAIFPAITTSSIYNSEFAVSFAKQDALFVIKEKSLCFVESPSTIPSPMYIT